MNTGRRSHHFKALIPLLLGAGPLMAGDVIYVDDDAPAAGDGTTWNTAYRFLADAIVDAESGDASAIHVGQGLYRPDRDEGSPGGTGDRTATFQLLSGVALRGGYAGFGAKDPDARDLEQYESILSGDLLGDDGPGFENAADNSEHVVTGDDVDETAALDGFTITGGRSPNRGAGIDIQEGAPLITDCRLVANQAGTLGGGLFVFTDRFHVAAAFVRCRFDGNDARTGGGASVQGSGEATFTDCTFSGNTAHDHAGLSSESPVRIVLVRCAFLENTATGRVGGLAGLGRVELTECTFIGNRAQEDCGAMMDAEAATLLRCTFEDNAAGTEGGAICLFEDGATLDDCVFRRNHARWGGAIFVARRVDSVITDCTFEANVADADGGAIQLEDTGDSTVIDCSFTNNDAGGYGGAVHAIHGANVHLVDCTFVTNTAARKGGAVTTRSSVRGDVTGCTFEANEATEGGAIFNLDVEAMAITGCSFNDNEAIKGGAISNETDDATIIGCTFSANRARSTGGAVATAGPDPITGCLFAGNRAGAFGGGLYTVDDTVVTNCAFSANVAGDSGGAIRGPSPVVTNCSFNGNAAIFGGAVSVLGDAAVLANCVVWGSAGGAIDESGSITVSYSDIEGGFAGSGNVDADPLFMDPDGPDGTPGTADDDLRLAAGSPCIDAGDNEAVPGGTPLDQAGDPRFRDDPDTTDTGRGDPPIVDIGAYEHQGCAADLDHSGVVDFADINAVLAAWGPCPRCAADLNGDEIVDFADILKVLAAWGECP